jgi:Calcineurin-like phosphoesterase
MKHANPAPAAFDLIGDIHGHYDKLTALLKVLGYRSEGGAWRHPEGRRVVFLGDYIDRGPRIRRVLRLVRGMCEAGTALAIMGNHEYNAVCYHTPDGNGDYLRPRLFKNRAQHAATLAEFFDLRDEWAEWIEWMKGLPFYLDLGGLRAVHAAWHPAEVAALNGATLRDPAFLRASATKGTPEFRAVETLLKGVELELPNGAKYPDKDGHHHKAIRSRWWENAPRGMSYRELIFPPADTPPPDPVPAHSLAALPGYAANEVPVFIGHYWLPADGPPAPLRPNLACLDYSAAHNGPLVAYRWDGEQELRGEKFIFTPNSKP